MIARSSREMARDRKIYGVAINDAPYIVTPTVDGKQVWCPYFRTWRGMLDRWRATSLAGVSVCEEWLRFMNFRDWMAARDWEGRQLDKDILKPGNMVYSPDTCAFVLPSTNRLMSAAHKDGTGRGVDFNMGRWRASYSGQLLGRFDTEDEAHWAWRAARARALAEAALKETDPRVPAALLWHAAELIKQEKPDITRGEIQAIHQRVHWLAEQHD